MSGAKIMTLPIASILRDAELYKKPQNIVFQYGTAGFRALYVPSGWIDIIMADRFNRGSLLHSVLFRMGILAALRSKKLDGKTIGVMITASHNPEPVHFFT